MLYILFYIFWSVWFFCIFYIIVFYFKKIILKLGFWLRWKVIMVIIRGFEGEVFFNSCFCRKNDSYRYFKNIFKGIRRRGRRSRVMRFVVVVGERRRFFRSWRSRFYNIAVVMVSWIRYLLWGWLLVIWRLVRLWKFSVIIVSFWLVISLILVRF